MREIIGGLDPQLPVLIAGPTGSGKSALALGIAETQGGTIVNADALQVWSCWRLLTARPSEEEEARVPHRLYGHVVPGMDYSVGHWLREMEAVLSFEDRTIIVGGTGLYFRALTEGLAEIPATPPELRAEADRRIATEGAETLLSEIDAETAARIDPLNPVRVQRAWEVLRTTGRGLADWQTETGPPLLPLERVTPLVMHAARDWLADRIDRRFDDMIAAGVLEEVRALMPIWEPGALWTKAIGAPELVAHLSGTLELAEAVKTAKLASRQYAKRQRTWFRNRMNGWKRLALP